MTDLVIPATQNPADIDASDEIALFDTDATYAELLAQEESYKPEGFTLTDKKDLLGVPHIITRVTYWTPPKDPKQMGMVSVEAVVGDIPSLMRAIERKHVPHVDEMRQLQVDPEERIVYNDGSTGVRRQLTQMFQAFGIIDVGGSPEDGDARFDRRWTDWDSFSQTRPQGDDIEVPSIGMNHKGRPLVIKVLRGLYVSEYSNDYTDEGRTYYVK